MAVPALSFEEWNALYQMAVKYSVVGITYAGVCTLPPEFRPPLEVAYQWASEAEAIRGHNRLVNEEAARLTEMFRQQGRRTAILKGAANARLYPDKFIRQCGDIDIWIEGGRESVIALLQKMKLMDAEPVPKPGKKSYEEICAEAKRKFSVSPHHVHLKEDASPVTVEAHFKVSSGNMNPFTTKRLMEFLDQEMERTEMVPEGFCVPSMKFALAMQLSHIKRHMFSSGIGFKQILDYYVLLTTCSDEDRVTMMQNLKRFGLVHTAGALMWVLEQVLGLDRERMLCSPDPKRGMRMLNIIFSGGNFGFYSKVESKSMVPRWFGRRFKVLGLFFFEPVEIFWIEVAYWKRFLSTIPMRIRLRKLSIREFF